MAFKDDEIEKSRVEDQAAGGKAKREAAERLRARRMFIQKAILAKKAKDARAYAQLLRLENVREGSAEWKEAWKFFYS